MTLPDFLIAGAPKCGTTALWENLRAHPQVFMPEAKEPRFFTAAAGELERGVPGSGPNRSGRYAEGLDWYRRLFAGRSVERAAGEASTAYFAAPDSPELIARHLPDVRLIFLLRDPVDRLYSHYWQERRLGWPLPPFDELLRTEHPRLAYYRHVSRYAERLGRYRQRFADAQILVLIAEELRDDPVSAFRRICAFLDVDPTFTPPSFGRRHNPPVLPKRPALQRLLSAAQGSPLARRLPGGVRAVLGRTHRRITRWNAEPLAREPLSPAQRAALAAGFGADVAYVEAWLGRPLDGWRAAAEAAS